MLSLDCKLGVNPSRGLKQRFQFAKGFDVRLASLQSQK